MRSKSMGQTRSRQNHHMIAVYVRWEANEVAEIHLTSLGIPL